MKYSYEDMLPVTLVEGADVLEPFGCLPVEGGPVGLAPEVVEGDAQRTRQLLCRLDGRHGTPALVLANHLS